MVLLWFGISPWQLLQHVHRTCCRRGIIQRKLIISLDGRVYERLHRSIGRNKTSQFIES